MAWLLEDQRAWIQKHGRRTKGGGWVCKETGKPINAKSFQKITPQPCFGIDDFLRGIDGNADMKTVMVLYCTACDKEPNELPAGSLIEVAD